MSRQLTIAGCVLLVLYLAMTAISFLFTPQFTGLARPTWGFFGIAIAAFVVSLFALKAVIRCPDDRRLLMGVLGFAVVFRLVLLMSHPIQEVDYYRYLWDGKVVSKGINPYQFSPQNVRNTHAATAPNTDLRHLATLAITSSEWQQILKRIHFGELTTVYPPVSQAVFGLATILTPENARLGTRITIMKAVFVAFDLATCILLMKLLSCVGVHRGFVVAYAWNPLVLKEIANSGHLDSIAICFCVASIWFIVRATQSARELHPTEPRTTQLALAAGFALAFAAGAKLFPIVLAPLCGWFLYRQTSTKATFTFVRTLLIGSAFLFTPWVLAPSPPEPAVTYDDNGDVFDSETVLATEPSKGISEFLSRWKINDFLFLIVYENLNVPMVGAPIEAWFVVTSHDTRWSMGVWLSGITGLPLDLNTFMVARAVTGFLFIAVVAIVLHDKSGSPHEFLEGVFLTLAWFWLTLPTQNPWYWLWALPFIPFAKSRVWYAMSGLVFIYYLRFWCKDYWPILPVFGTNYSGAHFFDFVIVWIEYAPWLLALALSRYGGVLRSLYSSSQSAENENDSSISAN